MSLPCPVERCDRPMPGTATICGACQAELARALAEVPALAVELETQLSRQGSRTAGGSGAETPLPYDARASEAAAVLRSALTGWVRVLQEGQPIRQGPVCRACDHPSCASMAQPGLALGSLALWLLKRSQRLAVHAAADEAQEEIVAAVGNAIRAVDRPPGYLYAGACDGCGYAVYAKPGATWAQCRTPRCPSGPVNVATRRDWMRQQCRDLLGGPSYVAMVCTGLGSPVTSSTVRVWISRKKIQPLHFAQSLKEGGKPQALYRVGDVLDVIDRSRQAARTA